MRRVASYGAPGLSARPVTSVAAAQRARRSVPQASAGVRQHILRMCGLAVLVASAASCSHGIVGIRPTLRLEFAGVEAPLRAGEYTDLRLNLVNAGESPVSVCVRARPTVGVSSQTYKRPLYLGGLVSENGCADELTLGPGGSREFNEHLWVWADLPDGPAVLTGGVVIRVGERGADTALSAKAAVTVTGKR